MHQIADDQIELLQVVSGQGLVALAGGHNRVAELSQLVGQTGANVIAVLNDENVASGVIALDHLSRKFGRGEFWPTALSSFKYEIGANGVAEYIRGSGP